jgi:hypothetical protein
MSHPASTRCRGATLGLSLLAGVGAAPAALAVDMTVWPGQDIQSAIDAVSDMGGGRVVLLEGTHPVRDSIELRGGVDLVGADAVRPARIVIKPDAATEPFNEPLLRPAPGAVLSDVRLEGFKVRCDIPAERQQQPSWIADLPLDAPVHAHLEGEQIGVALRARVDTVRYGVRNVRIADVEVRNCARGIFVDGGWNIELERLKLHRNGLVLDRFHNLEIGHSANVRVHRSSVYRAATGDGINVHSVSGVTIESNQAASNRRHGISLGRPTEPASPPSIAEFRLNANEVKRNDDAGLRLRHAAYGEVRGTHAWANGVNYDVDVIPGVRFRENEGGCMELPFGLGQYCDAGL